MNLKMPSCQQQLIRNAGFRGFASSVPASISVYLDSDVLRIPFQAILPTFVASVKHGLAKDKQATKFQTILSNNLKH